MRPLETMSDFFTARVDGYDEHMLRDVEGCREGYAEMARLVPAGTKELLDLGCGTGILCEILHKSGIEASGMDFSEGMIEIARNENPDIPFEVANMITFCPDRSYDLVTCTGDALNHIQSTIQCTL